MAKIMADLSKVPEPYLEPRCQDQYEVFEAFPPSEAAAAQMKPEFGKDISGDTVVPTPGSLYAELGGVEPVNLLSFAYQIASGMVISVIVMNLKKNMNFLILSLGLLIKY